NSRNERESINNSFFTWLLRIRVCPVALGCSGMLLSRPREKPGRRVAHHRTCDEEGTTAAARVGADDRGTRTIGRGYSTQGRLLLVCDLVYRDGACHCDADCQVNPRIPAGAPVYSPCRSRWPSHTGENPLFA